MRRRINLDKYEKPVEEPVGGGFVIGDMQFVMNDSLELRDVTGKVVNKQNLVWISDGRWSMHQMLVALLDITGPAEVHISSYAMGETPARCLVQLEDAGLITAIYCVLDNRIDTRSAGSLQVIMSLCNDYSLIDTHAKVTVIQNEKWSLTVIGSANYTENKRYEVGVILCSAEAAEHQVKWIKKALKDGSK